MNDDVLAQWRAWQEAAGLSDRTIAERDQTMTKLFEHSGADALGLTPAQIIAFCGRRELKPSSKATYHATIRAFCRWLIDTEQRADDPTRKTPTPKRPKSVPRPVLAPQLGRILGAVNRKRTRLMVLLAATAGLRVHEIAKLHADDIALFQEDGRWEGNMTVIGKGGQLAVIPMHDDLVACYRAHFGDVTGYLFPAYEAQSGAEHVGADAVRAAITRVMHKAGVNATPHQLRHWYGSELVKEDVQMRVVQGLMRHESLESTAIYTYTDLTMYRAALRRVKLPEARAA